MPGLLRGLGLSLDNLGQQKYLAAIMVSNYDYHQPVCPQGKEATVMSVAMKDGAWVSVTLVARFDCSRCGTPFFTSSHAMNDREIDEKIRQHANEKHGGKWTR